mmetsp:Transcript_54448/g.138327  ORF Transcript_54448/g.138327 Transcript_54448/m.138327 type:complete len:225 (-) Transcript_54448:653-1327(-)
MRIELILIVVLLLGVAAAEEERHLTDLGPAVLLVLPLFDISPEGCQASPKTRHEDVHGRVLRDLHHGVCGVPDAILARSDESQEGRAQTELGLPTFSLPIFADNQQLTLARAVITGRAYRVHPLLDGRNQLHVLVQRDLQGLELHQILCERHCPSLPVLELLCLALKGELRNLHLFQNILREWGKLLEELSRGLSEEVKVLGEELLDRGEDNSALLLLGGDLLR